MSQEATDVQATAPAAPAAVPAEPVIKPAAVEPPAVAPKTDDDEIAYEETGDARMDYALGFVARAGFDADHPAIIAASEGNFGLLKAALAEKGVAGWEQAVALGEEAYKDIVAKEGEKIETIRANVLEVAEQNGVDWEAAVEFARGHGDEQEIAKINELMADPFTAKIAALYITTAYRNNSDVDVPPQRQAVKPEAVPGNPGVSGGSLTRAEFAAEAGKLHKRMGDAYVQSQEYRALAARLQR